MTQILVAYASKHGATAEIAGAIARELELHGFQVDCREAGDVPSLEGYSAVVLGSAMYMGRWQGHARHFLHRHGDALKALPWWAFSSGPVGEPKPEDPSDARWLEPARTMAKAQALGVRAHVVFGGRVPTQPHNFVERAMTKNTPPQFADRRDWDEIADWANSIAHQLDESVVTAT